MSRRMKGIGTHTYVGGIFVKVLAIILVITGLLLSLYSTSMPQHGGEPIELYWIVSWVLFIVALILFATGVIVQRSALRRLRSQIADSISPYIGSSRVTTLRLN
jgi:hypothetical protein